MTTLRRISRVNMSLLLCVAFAYYIMACRGGEDEFKHIPVPVTQYFSVFVVRLAGGFPSPDSPEMHMPPEISEDYFKEGNVMVEVCMGYDFWPPQKLTIDFDGAGHLAAVDIDRLQYPYLDMSGPKPGKVLYILWPYEPAPELPYSDVSATLIDPNGVTHHYP